MKRGLIFLVIFVFLINLVSSQTSTTNCNLKVNLINQDPYPAVPSERLKIVFQIQGIENPSCGLVNFIIKENFPFSLLPGQTKSINLQSGTYSTKFNNFVLAPFEFKIHEESPDGENELSTEYIINSGLNQVSFLKDFNITVESASTDFEIYIKDFNIKTETITFEILNIGEKDAEALTVEIPKQNLIKIKGSNRNIVGSLDSNEDATFTFEAIPENGELKLNIFYNDEINVRRSVEKTVIYDSSYFTDRKRDETKISSSTYFFIAVLILVLYFWIRHLLNKRNKKKKRNPLY